MGWCIELTGAFLVFISPDTFVHFRHGRSSWFLVPVLSINTTPLQQHQPHPPAKGHCKGRQANEQEPSVTFRINFYTLNREKLGWASWAPMWRTTEGTRMTEDVSSIFFIQGSPPPIPSPPPPSLVLLLHFQLSHRINLLQQTRCCCFGFFFFFCKFQFALGLLITFTADVNNCIRDEIC